MRARCRPSRAWSPTSRRPRSTRSSARASSGLPPRRGASSSPTRSCARPSCTSSTCSAASGCTGAPRTRSAHSAKTATWRRSPHTCSRPPTPSAPPGCSSARAAARSTASPTRTRQSASPARSTRSRSPDAEREAGPVLLARGDALLRAGEPAAARESFTEAARLARRTNDAGLLGEAALGFAGLGIAIVGLDAETIARLEEALESATDAVLRSRLQARLAVELYYAPDRTRSEALSAEAVATARGAGNGRALASALNARHVALWRPDRVEERLATAADMIAAARETGERHAELQARNWRVADLFELGDMPAFREEVARHARLADELRLPSFQWYTPLWSAVEALLAGRFEEAERTGSRRRRSKACGRATATPSCSPRCCVFTGQLERGEFEQVDIAFIEDKIANSPAGPAYAASYAWVLAGLGDTERARTTLDRVVAQPHAFDANWMSAQAECAEACVLLGDATHAAVFYDRLLPYAGRPATAGRAVASYGAVDRHLGGLAALLGRRDDAERHLRAGIARNHELGCSVWAEHTERWLHALG